MSKKPKKPMATAELVVHEPNPLALATSLRGGKGAHNTGKTKHRRDRREARQENREREG